MNKITFKKVYVSFKNFFVKKEHRTISEKAHYDWKAMIIGFFISGIILVGLSSLLFLRVRSGEQFIAKAPESVNKNSLDVEALVESVEVFRNKKTQIEIIKVTPPNVTDPSL